MFRVLFLSTLYSSSRPFSSRATRRSSFSTLMTSFLPVLREPRPKIRFTFSIIGRGKLCDHVTVWGHSVHAVIKVCAAREPAGVAVVGEVVPASGRRVAGKNWVYLPAVARQQAG